MAIMDPFQGAPVEPGLVVEAKIPWSPSCQENVVAGRLLPCGSDSVTETSLEREVAVPVSYAKAYVRTRLPSRKLWIWVIKLAVRVG
jgi:hypothetical protein